MSILFLKIWGYSVFWKFLKIDILIFFFEKYTKIPEPINCTGIEYFIGGGDFFSSFFLNITKRIFECDM